MPAMRKAARKKADAIVERYEKASGHHTVARLYSNCDVIEMHTPRRSYKARHAYQRDRRLMAKYENLMEAIWPQGINTMFLYPWDTEAHAYVRRKTYRPHQEAKAPRSTASAIQELLAQDMSQAAIACELSISRQAVSAAIKRQKQ